jgi:hypothetical protein
MKTSGAILAVGAVVGLGSGSVAAQSDIAVDSVSFLLATDYACGELVEQCPTKGGGDSSDETFGFLAKYGGLNSVLECLQNNIDEVASRPTCGGELKSTYDMLYPDSETAFSGDLEGEEVNSVFMQAGATTAQGLDTQLPFAAAASGAGLVGVAAVVMMKTKRRSVSNPKCDGVDQVAPSSEFALPEQDAAMLARIDTLTKEETVDML